GATAHLAEQRLPFMARQALIVPVGAGMLAAMIEKALIVVLRLKRLDLRFDEGVEHLQIVGDLPGDRKIHVAVLPAVCLVFEIANAITIDCGTAGESPPTLAPALTENALNP